jgi:hypothetical protein
MPEPIGALMGLIIHLLIAVGDYLIKELRTEARQSQRKPSQCTKTSNITSARHRRKTERRAEQRKVQVKAASGKNTAEDSQRPISRKVILTVTEQKADRPQAGSLRKVHAKSGKRKGSSHR